MLENTTLVSVPVKRGAEFYMYWVEFLGPLHRLQPPAKRLMSALLTHRESIASSVSKDDDVDCLLFSTQRRKQICKELDIMPSYMNKLLSDLRKCKALVGNRVNPRFLPHMHNPDKNYRLIVEFDINGKR